MFQGFYNLTSSMITQKQNLNVISNNLVNMTTPGYKADTYVATTFKDEVFYRMGNTDRRNEQQIGTISMAKVGAETVTSFEDGGVKQTDGSLDFAIAGDGFFKIALPGGGFAYSRNGAFALDEEGCLTLKGIGKVQGQGGDIILESDQISAGSDGSLYDRLGDNIDNLAVVDFADYGQLTKGANGTFTTAQAEVELESPTVRPGYLENSNANAIQETSSMITVQRTYQSAAQLLKMYDQIMSKATTEIGKL